MTAAQPLASILDACERLRRLPAPRWEQAPRPPQGSRAPDAAIPQGAPLQDQVAACMVELMTNDAHARGVAPFIPEVSVLSLPDVLAALARSVAARADDEGKVLLARIADQLRSL